MLSEDMNILACNQYQKSDETPFTIYEDLETWMGVKTIMKYRL